MNNDLADSSSTLMQQVTSIVNQNTTTIPSHNHDDRYRYLVTTVSGNISANATRMTLSNGNITTSRYYDIYSSVYTVIPTNMTISSGKAVFTFSSSHAAATIILYVYDR